MSVSYAVEGNAQRAWRMSMEAVEEAFLAVGPSLQYLHRPQIPHARQPKSAGRLGFATAADLAGRGSPPGPRLMRHEEGILWKHRNFPSSQAIALLILGPTSYHDLAMFDVNFTHASATPLPPSVSIDLAIDILHHFEAVIKLSPDCRGCTRLPPPKAKNGTSKKSAAATNGDATTEIQYWEVADDLPFMPKKMWSGGVKYNAEFVAQGDGCDITVHAPGGFTSTNHWRIVREMVHEDELPSLTRVRTKDLLHAETGPGEGGWYVQIVSDARCSVTFQGIVKGFLKNSHVQLQKAFIEKLREPAHLPREKRPELGRRRSTHH
ncbi:hypothetical protein LTS00_000129 [Friedmanniomyces endolithicus]|nr:hypothetical protein LTS00_000129 [Friedmanniomyces endolithicus]